MSNGAKEDFSKRFAPNLVMNVIYVVASSLIGLLLVPFFIDELGIAAYGIVPLATSITGYLTIISDSIVNAVFRYIAVEIQNDDWTEANTTYNTAIFGVLKVVVGLIPIMAAISIASPYIFNISDNSTLDVVLLFAGILGSVLIVTWTTIFSVILAANNRIDLQASLRLLQLLVQTSSIVLSFVIFGPSLATIGAAYILGALAFGIVSFVMSRRISPELVIEHKRYSSDRFKALSEVGFWNIISAIGNLLFIQMSIILANVFYGSSASGLFSIVASLISMIVTICATLSNLFVPITYHNYSVGNKERTNDTCILAIKAVGVIMGPMIAFIFVFSPQILTIWVGAEYADLHKMVWVTLLLMVGFEAIAPVYPLALAHLKIKIPALGTLLFGAINILIATILYLLGTGLIGIAIAWTVSMGLKNCVFFPWYHAKIAGAKPISFFIPLIYGFVSFGSAGAVCFLIEAMFHPQAEIVSLVVIALLFYSVYTVMMTILLFKREERGIIAGCLPDSISKHIPRRLI